MVNKQFIWHLETSNLIIKEQCGFRKKHSIVDIDCKNITKFTKYTPRLGTQNWFQII